MGYAGHMDTTLSSSLGHPATHPLLTAPLLVTTKPGSHLSYSLVDSRFTVKAAWMVSNSR